MNIEIRDLQELTVLLYALQTVSDHRGDIPDEWFGPKLDAIYERIGIPDTLSEEGT